MIVAELKSVLEGLPADMPVHVIMDGVIDSTPEFNVDDDIIYIEGVSPSKQEMA